MDGVVVDGVWWGWRDHHQQQAMEGIHYSTLPLQFLRGTRTHNQLRGNLVAFSQDEGVQRLSLQRLMQSVDSPYPPSNHYKRQAKHL